MTSDGPMVIFSDCQGRPEIESRRGCSLKWIDFSFLYVKDILVHIECEAVFRPRMPIFLLGK